MVLIRNNIYIDTTFENRLLKPAFHFKESFIYEL